MFKLLLAFLVALAVFASTFASDSGLGPYKVSDVTVSGISSGGYMAVQMHISHSAIVNGSAVFAGVRQLVAVLGDCAAVLTLLF